MKCIICKKELNYKFYTIDGIRKNTCRKCQRDFRNTEPNKTMPHEKRIEILLENRRAKINKEKDEICGRIFG